MCKTSDNETKYFIAICGAFSLCFLSNMIVQHFVALAN